MDEKQRDERKPEEAPPRRRPAGLFRTIVLPALAACPAAGCYDSTTGDDVADTADATDARDGADDGGVADVLYGIPDGADDATGESVLAYGVPEYGSPDYAAPEYYAP
jgi:hypothetical protein